MAIRRYRPQAGFETIGGMTTPRHLLVDPENECDYHLVSRCVRRAFLCGVDDLPGRDCSHRRALLLDRMKQLAPCFMKHLKQPVARRTNLEDDCYS